MWCTAALVSPGIYPDGHVPILGTTKQHVLRVQSASRETYCPRETTGGLFQWPSCSCNFTVGGPSGGGITSHSSPPCNRHSCGWLTGGERGSIATDKPDEDEQLHRQLGGCRWQLDGQLTLDEQLAPARCHGNLSRCKDLLL